MKFSKKTRYVLLALCAATTLTLFLRHESHRDLRQIKAEQVLRIEIDTDDSDSTLLFHQNLAKQIADSLGVKVQFISCHDLQMSLRHLRRGQCDVIARYIPMGNEISNSQHSAPLNFNKFVLVHRSNDTLNSYNDLRKKIIYTANNSDAIMRINHISEDIGDSIFIIQTDSTDQSAIAMVSNGKINYYACDQRTANRYADSLLCVFQLGYPQAEGWVMRQKSKKLKLAVDSIIADINQNY